MNNIQFEDALFAMRMAHYRHRTVDILREGFRPVGGTIGDFCCIAHEGRYHFFYPERRLQEATSFYPGHGIYLGHASTANFEAWEVHDPAILICPGTWESAHVWAPYILRYQGRYVMAYTGVNDVISQDIGLAWSDDLFHWERDGHNPISPCKGRAWAFWRTDGIASCRDPHLLVHEGRIWMTYTANTAQGATCVGLISTADLVRWEDHGPVLVGPGEGYEPDFQGAHPQGSLESSNLFQRGGRWYLLAMFNKRDSPIRNWIYESDRMDCFELDSGREFWRGGYTTEFVAEKGSRSLLACAGTLRLGEVDWSQPQPMAQFLATLEQLAFWRG